MKKSVKRQRKAEVLLLLTSLVVLSVVYIGLLSSSYSTYLTEQDAHALTYEENASLPSVAVSIDDASSADTTVEEAVGSGSSKADADAANEADAVTEEDDELSGCPGDADTSDTGSSENSDDEDSAATYERSVSGHAILLGDTDMLSIYSYDPTGAAVCTTSGISTANVLTSSFTVPEVSTKERTVQQILNIGSYDTCYLFLGVHEAEWYYEDSFIEYYETLIMEIKDLAPDTVIYIHAIPSTALLAEAGVTTSATEEHIAELNVRLNVLAAEFDGVIYVE